MRNRQIEREDETEGRAQALQGRYWVAAYLATRARCGGAEEGSSYDEATLVTDPDIYRQLGEGAASFGALADAEAHARAMRQRLAALNQGRRPRPSHNATGMFEVRICRCPALPLSFPESPPSQG